MAEYIWFSVKQHGDEILFTEMPGWATKFEPEGTCYNFKESYSSKVRQPPYMHALLSCAGLAGETDSVVLNKDKELAYVYLFGHRQEDIQRWQKGIAGVIQKYKIPTPKK